MSETKYKEIPFAAYPPVVDENPSIELFHNALASKGFVNCSFDFGFKELYKNRERCKVLLFHWPSYFWDSKSLIKSLLKFSGFAAKTIFAKILGYKLIWSAHNTFPHKINYFPIEKYSRLFMIRWFDIIINHSLNASEERLAAFGIKGKIEVNAIHGHYESVYKPGGHFSRSSLGIPLDAKTIFLHANMRDYKGDAEFIDSFIKFAPDDLYLILMGKGCAAGIRRENIKCIEGYRSNSEMADLIEISDYFALPYKKITTSGAFFLAVTFKKPIIATNLPFFVKHIYPDTGLLYKIGDESIENIFKTICDGWAPDTEMLDKMKQAYTWENAAKAVRGAIENII